MPEVGCLRRVAVVPRHLGQTKVDVGAVDALRILLDIETLTLCATRASVSRAAWNLGDDPSWTLGGGTDAFGAGVGVSLEGGDELGHLLVALDAAE